MSPWSNKFPLLFCCSQVWLTALRPCTSHHQSLPHWNSQSLLLEAAPLAPSIREPSHLPTAQPQRFLLLANLPSWKGLSQSWGSAVTGRGSRRDQCIWMVRQGNWFAVPTACYHGHRLGNPSTVLLPFSNSTTKDLDRILIPTSVFAFSTEGSHSWLTADLGISWIIFYHFFTSSNPPSHWCGSLLPFGICIYRVAARAVRWWGYTLTLHNAQ